jgi:DNA-binding NarL/FixJ family response regulator
LKRSDFRFFLGEQIPAVQRLAAGITFSRIRGYTAQSRFSVRTVENHRAKVLRKLDVDSVPELVRYAIRNKMIEP